MNKRLIKKIQKAAIKAYPFEMVGYVVGNKFTELDNVSNNKAERYSLSAKDKVMIFEIGDSLTALVHSHPSNDNKPSDMDIKSQRACKFPFWIVGTDGVTCTDIMEINDNG